MTLLDRILARGTEMPIDPIIAARLERHMRRIQPDPLFRRRLRGQVLNRYVAAREGLVPVVLAPKAARRDMGILGRGVLYASLMTAMGVTAVGAASQDSLPGDALYGVKLHLESIRMQIAPPGLRDDLAAMALDGRLREVEALAAAGRWALVDEAAARAAEAEDQLATILGADAAANASERSEAAKQQHADRLTEIIETAPLSAKPALERALDASTSEYPPAVEPRAAEPPANQPDQGGNQKGGDEEEGQGGVQAEIPDAQPAAPQNPAPAPH
ncbi:MAG TPA: DUF5667 domain-containing protein [Candidatus Limnocylindria bacterium]|nr:DUF5667 domain-containing protein [Candidatus Limnocylindria bacterium]